MNENYKDCEQFCKLFTQDKDEKQIIFYFSAGLYFFFPYEYNISPKKIEQVVHDITIN